MFAWPVDLQTSLRAELLQPRLSGFWKINKIISVLYVIKSSRWKSLFVFFSPHQALVSLSSIWAATLHMWLLQELFLPQDNCTMEQSQNQWEFVTVWLYKKMSENNLNASWIPFFLTKIEIKMTHPKQNKTTRWVAFISIFDKKWNLVLIFISLTKPPVLERACQKREKKGIVIVSVVCMSILRGCPHLPHLRFISFCHLFQSQTYTPRLPLTQT